ncbi:MAG: filamentous hemagglutinin family outer membrane protein [Verrucomicrobia bacterium]|nr:filamentous hemagglutinin family outer membrane protein [Verrucomicrobiota bacterium]
MLCLFGTAGASGAELRSAAAARPGGQLPVLPMGAVKAKRLLEKAGGSLTGIKPRVAGAPNAALRNLAVAPVSAFGFLRTAVLLTAPPSVVLDQRLGQTQQPAITSNTSGRNDYGIRATMGKQVGGNLFFSFAAFGLATNESATFGGPFSDATSVQNILARVTGGSTSSIDGTIRSQIPGANLYLINPAGVLFGPNARLDVSGSFAVSTADYLRLADDARFDVANAAHDLTLTAAPVSAFGFLTAAAAPVSVSGSQLATRPGADFTVVGGNLTLHAATLAAPSARLALVSVAAGGEVPASMDALAALPAHVLSAMGRIELRNHASVQIDGDGGGALVLRGGQLQLEGGSTVQSRNLGAAAGGDVDVRLTDSLLIHDGQIRANVLGTGPGGKVRVEAPSIVVDGGMTSLAAGSEAYIGIIANVAEGANGAGGDVLVTADEISLLGTASISAATFGNAPAGNVSVTASTVTIDGRGSPKRTEISSRVESAGFAHAGNVVVSVRENLSLLGGGQIAADTSGHGDAGSVRVSASTLLIDGQGLGSFTGISSDVNTTGHGHGGPVMVSSNDLVILGHGQITADIRGVGDAGSVDVTAVRLRVDGQGINLFTGISSGVATTGHGHGGPVMVSSNDLVILGGGQIAADTSGHGDAGSVRVSASTLLIDGQGLGSFTGISSDVNKTGHGHGGPVMVSSNDLVILGHGQITADIRGVGDAGTVAVASARLRLDAQGVNFFTGISSDVATTGIGHGGAVTVRSEDLVILGRGQITADIYGVGDAGSVEVTAPRLRVDGQGIDSHTGIFSDVYSTGVGHGGAVTVRSEDLVIANHGQIVADSFGHGDAGSVNITARNLSITQKVFGSTPILFTGISAEGTENAGGNITVLATNIIVDGPGNPTLLGALAGTPITGIEAITSGAGRGGNITVTATGSLRLLGTGQFATNTYGAGRGGDMVVSAPRILISGTNSGFFAVSGKTKDFRSDLIYGVAGRISVHACHLTIEGGGFIATSSFTRGASGDVLVIANDILIKDPSAIPIIEAGITASSFNVVSGGPAGAVTVRADTLTLLRGGAIGTLTENAAAAGDVNILAGHVFIDGEGAAARTGIIADTGLLPLVSALLVALPPILRVPVASPGGAGGTVHLKTALLEIHSGGEVSASTTNGGHGGSVEITSNRIVIDGEGTTPRTGIFSTSADGYFGGGGSGGDVRVHAGQVELRGKGSISAATAGRGDGGRVEVTANGLVLADRGQILANTSAGGRGGTIAIRTGDLQIESGGQIAAGTSGAGDAGDVIVHSGSIVIDGSSGPAAFTGVRANSASGATGAAGDLRLNVTGALNVTGGGQISASTSGSGAGGTVKIEAGAAQLDTGGTIAATSGGSGVGGSLAMRVTSLSLDHGAAIKSSSTGPAAAGSVQIDARRIGVSHGSSLAALATGAGSAGDVMLRVREDLSVDSESTISTSARLANAGVIVITAGNRVDLTGGSSITASAGASGGSVRLLVGDTLLVRESQITATAGSVRLVGAAGASGSGGNIFIDPRFVILDHAVISANAAAGQGGNIELTAQNFFNSESVLTATGTQAGTINIAAPEFDLVNGLTQLTGALDDASIQLREQCARSLNRDFSSFLVLGGGGVETAPDAPAASTDEDEARRREARER